MAAEPVPNEQEQFLAAVFGREQGYLFISTKDRTQDSNWRDQSFVYPLQVADILAYVKQQDDAGLDVYVAAQLYKEPNRRLAKNVKICPSAWSDLDTACPWGIDPEPNVVLETSPGRWHGFWRVTVPMPPAEAEAISRQIAYAHHRAGADLGGWDLTQVLRIPGTHNHKPDYPDRPVVVMKRCDPKPIPRSAFAVLPAAPKKHEGAGAAPDDDGAAPIQLAGADLEHWQKEAVPDRSAWAMRMVGILKDNGLSDRLVEVALANHPIYLAKAREKWGNKESLIYDDIRRCLQRWRETRGPSVDFDLEFGPSHSAGNAAPSTTPPTATTEGRYPIQSLADLILLSDDRPEQIVDGLIWPNRVTWAFSDPNSGKTLFLLAALMHVAAGRPFCGKPVKQMPVMIFEEDSPLSVVGEYIIMLTEIYDFDLEQLPMWINKVQGLRIVGDEGEALVRDAINACPQRPGIVLFDACERIVPSDRFNTKELDPLTKTLQRLIGDHITPIVIDHTNRAKPEKGQEKEVQANPMERLFGARAKSAISDVMLYFNGFLKNGPVDLVFAKFRGETPQKMTVKFDGATGFDIIESPLMAQNENERMVIRFFNNAGSGEYSVADVEAAVALKRRTLERVLHILTGRRWLVATGSTTARRYRLNHRTDSF